MTEKQQMMEQQSEGMTEKQQMMEDRPGKMTDQLEMKEAETERREVQLEKTLKEMKQCFPDIPENVREMICDEVKRQLSGNRAEKKARENSPLKYEMAEIMKKSGRTGETEKTVSRRRWLQRALPVGLAAAMAIGVTAFAGVNYFRLQNQKNGIYGLETSIQIDDENMQAAKVPEELHHVEIKWNYLPQGLVQPEDEPLKIFHEDHPYQGGVSAEVILMDQDIHLPKAVQNDQVVYNEEMSIAGREAVYMEFDRGDQEFAFDKRMYVIYPEVWRVLELYGGTDVNKEEFCKVAEGIELVETDEVLDLINDLYTTWSDIAEPDEETVTDDNIYYEVQPEQMKNLYQIGDLVDFSTMAELDGNFTDTSDLKMKVTDVQVAEDLSLLTSAEDIPETWPEQTGADGKLTEEERRYIRSGDGVDTLDEIVDTMTVSQKLVYITVEFTNAGEETYTNVLYAPPMLYLEETDGKLRISDHPADDAWDYVIHTGAGGSHEMQYHDAHPEPGTTNGSNYISSLDSGETVTVHLAWIVDEDELDKMYLSLDPSAYTFTDHALEAGYVDIRQS